MTDDIDLKNVFTLPAHAIAVFFALRECGPMTHASLCKLLGKSKAAIYRSLIVIRDHGLETDRVITPNPPVVYSINSRTNRIIAK